MNLHFKVDYVPSSIRNFRVWKLLIVDLIWFDFGVNVTFSNISAISWRPVLVVEEAGVYVDASVNKNEFTFQSGLRPFLYSNRMLLLIFQIPVLLLIITCVYVIGYFSINIRKYVCYGWFLTQLSTIFKLYRGGKFYCWSKPVYTEKTTFKVDYVPSSIRIECYY
jgi:hypothetical protein